LASKSPDYSKLQTIRVNELDVALQMLKTYVNVDGIKPLLAAIETLITDPQNQAHQDQVCNAFDALGPLQGPTLTYAPYLHIFTPTDVFGD
jgi:hypothetical protein